MAADLNGWQAILDRYGLPLAGMVVMCWIIVKVGLPWLQKQIDKNQELMSSQVRDTQRRLDESQKRIDKSGDEFLQALKRRDEIMEEGFQKLHDHLSNRSTNKRKPK